MEYTVYLSNRSPTQSVWKKLPQETWSGKKPDISHLRIFKSIAFVHVPNERRIKLDNKRENFIRQLRLNPNNKKVVTI